MEIKQKLTVQSLFWRFLIWFCALTGISALICFAIFTVLFSAGVILPANYEENILEVHREEIQNAPKVTTDMIPAGSLYGVFDTDGTFLYGDLTKSEQREIWKTYEQGESTYGGIGYLKYFRRENEICIASYKIKAKFANDTLSRWLPGVDVTVLLVFLALFFGESILLIRKFGNFMTKELKNVKIVTEKVRMQNLEFDKPETQITEVDDVMDSLVRMRDALTVSLKEQWKMEEKRKQQIGALIHDIKTPLTVIRGNTQLLQEAESAEESREYEKYILLEADRIEEYIKILQNMLRSEDAVLFQKEKIDLMQTAEGFAHKAKMLAGGKEQNLEVVISCVTDYIYSDRQLLLRAWENLLSNALEYTPSGGEILISILEDDEKLVFEIEDSGPGFTKEALLRGTEQFYQGDISRSSRSHYGMGLFMVKSFIRQQGGNLMLGNSAKKKGALVRLEMNL
jgi:signal transduction histidine kinase